MGKNLNKLFSEDRSHYLRYQIINFNSKLSQNPTLETCKDGRRKQNELHSCNINFLAKTCSQDTFPEIRQNLRESNLLFFALNVQLFQSIITTISAPIAFHILLVALHIGTLTRWTPQCTTLIAMASAISFVAKSLYEIQIHTHHYRYYNFEKLIIENFTTNCFTVPLLQTSPSTLNTSSGQYSDWPVQYSGKSHSWSADRHTVPAVCGLQVYYEKKSRKLSFYSPTKA